MVMGYRWLGFSFHHLTSLDTLRAYCQEYEQNIPPAFEMIDDPELQEYYESEIQAVLGG